MACLQAKPTHHITVDTGDKVRIGVDPSIAKKGWLVVRNTSLVTQELIKNETYWTVDGDQLFTEQDPQTGQTQTLKTVTLNIVESGDTSGADSYRVIQFTLNRGE